MNSFTPRFEWRIISLHQPHASLFPAKKFETRHWNTNFRGPVFIHAAQTRTQMGLLSAVEGVGGQEAVRYRVALRTHGHDPQNLPFGAVVGYGFWRESVTVSPLWLKKQDELDPQSLWFGDFRVGRYAHRITNFHALPSPCAHKGMQGFPRIDPLIFLSSDKIDNFEKLCYINERLQFD